jgi:acyl carrier protein
VETLEEAFLFAREELATLEPEVTFDDLDLDADLSALDLDSVTVLSLVAALEDRYGTRIPNGSLLQVRTMRELLNLALAGAATGGP